MGKGKPVSLVLGSGGARGLAHIGVIDWLVEHNFEIRSIAGSSMGALIGGIYAAGELDTYRHWVKALDKSDVLGLLDLSFGSGGLFKGEKVIERLRDLIGARSIEELPIAFTAVATDVEQQKEVWINKGSLFDAIRASIAVPLVFTPFRREGRRLLDGGLLNPLPIAPTLTDTTDLTIAVNLGGRPEESLFPLEEAVAPHETIPVSAEEEQDYSDRIKAFVRELQGRFTQKDEEDWDFFDIMAMSIDAMQNTITRMKLAAYNPDVTVTICRDAARAYEFYRAAELIELGYQQTDAVLGPLVRKE
ncbi:MAG: patatin-like phospholipase family protein [Pseudomonadota bacterium]|nr:MAG: patatin-like phospholipase family protein [Pseudomonadota bacterium]